MESSRDEHELWAAAGGLEASYLANPSLIETGPTPPAERAALPPGHAPEGAGTVRPPGLVHEARALWVTRWDYRTAGDIRIIADRAAGANFNMLFFQVRGNGDAFYRSRLEPWATRLGGTLGQDPGWDPLDVAVAEAHARGLELHAWLNVYPAWLGETPPPATTPETMFSRFNRLYGQAWVMWDRHRQPMQLNREYLWASPGHWAVHEHIVDVCKDVAGRYYVDGLHLDNVRYAGWEYSTDPVTGDRLAQALALEPGLTQKEWQRRQVNGLVAAVRATLDGAKPGLPLTAAVWPVYYDTWDWWHGGDGFSGFCQDSVGWLRAGDVSAICPMLYLGSITTDDAQYAALVKDFVSRGQHLPVYAGITTTYDTFTPIGRRIDIARTAGAAGQALFAYGHVNSRGYWDEFRTGPYAQPALAPPPPAPSRPGAA
jgi:uncharacterized lipoprotein YddW (UPF0748 family)